MNLALFLMVLVVSFIVVRIGAIAFQLTGLEWSMAKFQAISCFTSTGFTTKEAEMIATDPRRRRIASTLMVLGHAGLVTMIATLVNSLRTQEIIEGFSKPVLDTGLSPALVQLLHVVILIIGVYLIYKFFTNVLIARKLTEILKKRVIKRQSLKPISREELLVATGGYGVATGRVCTGHPILGKPLSESGLRKDDIIVLAIIRASETTPNPPAEAKILDGDELICFGKLEQIRQEFA